MIIVTLLRAAMGFRHCVMRLGENAVPWSWSSHLFLTRTYKVCEKPAANTRNSVIDIWLDSRLSRHSSTNNTGRNWN